MNLTNRVSINHGSKTSIWITFFQSNGWRKFQIEIVIKKIKTIEKIYDDQFCFDLGDHGAIVDLEVLNKILIERPELKKLIKNG